MKIVHTLHCPDLPTAPPCARPQTRDHSRRGRGVQARARGRLQNRRSAWKTKIGATMVAACRIPPATSGTSQRQPKIGQRPHGEGLTGSIVVSGTPCGAIMKTKRRADSVILAFFETM